MSEQNKIDEIKEALAAASPGPWEHMNSYDVFTLKGVTNREGVTPDVNDGWHICEATYTPTFVDGELVDLSHREKHANARFIAKSPEYITYLLQEITTLKTNLEYWEPMANRLADSVEMLQRESRRYAQVGAEAIEERDRLLAEIERKDEALNEIELILTDDTSTQAIEINQVINRAREAL